MSDAREVMSWADLGTGCRELAETIHADDWVPDLVLGISRGGLLVAVHGLERDRHPLRTLLPARLLAER